MGHNAIQWLKCEYSWMTCGHFLDMDRFCFFSFWELGFRAKNVLQKVTIYSEEYQTLSFVIVFLTLHDKASQDKS